MKRINNEKGAILVIALIIIGLAAAMGTVISMTSSIELNIARNEKMAKNSFYEAENGRIMAGTVLRSAGWGASFSDGDSFSGNNNIVVLDGDFFMESIEDPDTATDSPDVQLSGSIVANVDVDKLRIETLPGGSAEFGAGYEGAGKEGSVQSIYLIDSIGTGASSSSAQVTAEYRLVPP